MIGKSKKKTKPSQPAVTAAWLLGMSNEKRREIKRVKSNGEIKNHPSVGNWTILTQDVILNEPIVTACCNVWNNCLLNLSLPSNTSYKTTGITFYTNTDKIPLLMQLS